MKQKIAIIIGCSATIVVLLLLNLTTPSGIGPFGVLLFLAALYVAIASFLYVGLNALRVTLRTIFRVKPRPEHELSRTELYYFASVLALVPVILLGIQSVGGVKVSDIMLLVAFEFLACLYVHKRF